MKKWELILTKAGQPSDKESSTCPSIWVKGWVSIDFRNKFDKKI